LLGRVLESCLLGIAERKAEDTTNAFASHDAGETQKDVIFNIVESTDTSRGWNDTVGVTQDILGNVSRS
jgi:hypothetical protein